ncbi:hypothetical protein CR513_43299, partial [Mucuna pruriens]
MFNFSLPLQVYFRMILSLECRDCHLNVTRKKETKHNETKGKMTNLMKDTKDREHLISRAEALIPNDTILQVDHLESRQKEELDPSYNLPVEPKLSKYDPNCDLPAEPTL